MGSKSTQNLPQMPNLLSDYVGYNLNLSILGVFWADFYRYLPLRGRPSSAGPSCQVATLPSCQVDEALASKADRRTFQGLASL